VQTYPERQKKHERQQERCPSVGANKFVCRRPGEHEHIEYIYKPLRPEQASNSECERELYK